jgi:transposase-like protein
MSKSSSRNAASWLITSRSTGRFNAPPLHVDAARPCRHRVGDRWFVDETYAKVASIWLYVSPVVDQHGQVIDVYVSKRRDIASATTFFTTMLQAHNRPQDVTTDLAAPIWLHQHNSATGSASSNRSANPAPTFRPTPRSFRSSQPNAIKPQATPPRRPLRRAHRTRLNRAVMTTNLRKSQVPLDSITQLSANRRPNYKRSHLRDTWCVSAPATARSEQRGGGRSRPCAPRPAVMRR